MLSPITIGKYKRVLVTEATHGGYLIKGTRLYRLVGHVSVFIPLLGKYARQTLCEYQRRHGLPVTGELDAATRESLIPVDLRAGVVKWARWGVANTSEIHYSQSGSRMAAVHQPGHLPLYTDCSAFDTLCYSWSGAPDPNGLGYNGTGYTGTLIARGKTVTQTTARPGDLVFYGAAPAHHVAMVVEAGVDPLLVSHGQEAGPLYIRQSQEAASQARNGHSVVTFKSYLP